MTLTEQQAQAAERTQDRPPEAPTPAVSPRGAPAPARELAAMLGWALVGAALFLGLWQLAALRSPDLPSPSKGIGELLRLISDPFYDNGPNDKGIGSQLAISLQRVFGGFALAAIVGVPLGLLIGGSRRAWQAANPVIQMLRPVSPLAWFPIFLVVLKDTGRASVFVIFVTALWPTVVNTASGAASIPLDQRNVAKVFPFGRFAYLRHVLVPNAIPSIVTGLRLSMGIAWMVIVAVEMLSGSAGIGFFVWNSYNADNLAAVIASIALIGLVGVALDWAFNRLGRRLLLTEEARP